VHEYAHRNRAERKQTQWYYRFAPSLTVRSGNKHSGIITSLPLSLRACSGTFVNRVFVRIALTIRAIGMDSNQEVSVQTE
jgi:hypothetical protein